jgi:hypothetical protein
MDRPARCQLNDGSCKKRITLTDFKCKCDKFYCAKHRAQMDHTCPFDYFAESQKELLKTMSTAVTAAKIDQI